MSERIKYAIKATFEDGTVKYWCGHPKGLNGHWEECPESNNSLYLFVRKGNAQNFCDDLPWRARRVVKYEIIEVRM